MDWLTYAFAGTGIGAVNVLVAAGLLAIYRGSGVINFAQGGFALLGAYLVFEFQTEQGLGFVPSLLLAVAIVAAVGIATHWLVMRPLRRASPLARVIATLGVLTIVTQVVLLQYTAMQRTVDVPLPSRSVHIGDAVIASQNLYLVGIAAALALVLTLLMARTRVGRALTASAENPRAAAALGWSPDLLATLTWGAGGALAGLAGSLFPATSTGFISVTQMSVLIIGGLATALLAQFRSFPLALVGGLLIGMVQSLSTRYTDQTGLADSIPFLVIVLVLVVRGRGLPVRGTVTDRLPRIGTGRIRWWVAVPLAVAAFVVLRTAVPEDWQPKIVLSLCVAIVGLSVVIVSGYAGQLSLAQFALAGVGAYAAGRLAAAHGWSIEAALVAGVVVAAIVGCVVGLPALRTRGINLAVVTFGLGFAIHQLVFSNSDYTGRDAQTKIVDPTFLGFDIDPIRHEENFATLCLAALLVCCLIVANVRRGRSGRRLLAVRTNERAAASVGISVFQVKLYAFTLASAVAGLGGALYGFSYPTILYQQLFPPDASISVLVGTVIGGVGYVFGPVLGSMLAKGGAAELFFGDATSATDSSAIRYLPLATGIILLVTLLGSQHGVVDRVVETWRALTRRFGATRKAAAPAEGDQRDTQAVRVEPRRLRVQGLVQRFGGFTALEHVSLEVAPGEVVGLLGPNGAGKTTLLDAVTGFAVPAAGTVSLDDVDVTRWSAHRRARAGLTRSFQSLELFDDLTVAENLLAASDPRDLAAYATDLVRPGRPVFSDTVEAAIDELGLRDVLDLRPEELSHGRRRLVSIARSVATRPSVLLLDEPAAGLDEHESAEVGHLVRRLADDWGIAVLLIEHDVPMVLRTADRVHVIDFGRTIFEGTPEQVRDDAVVRAAYLGHAGEQDAVG